MTQVKRAQLVGFVCWRAGLMLLGSYAFFRIARLALIHVDWPTQIEIGASLVLAGCALVMGSFVAERIVDARAEGDLTQ